MIIGVICYAFSWTQEAGAVGLAIACIIMYKYVTCLYVKGGLL